MKKSVGFREGKMGSFCAQFLLSLEAYLDYGHTRRSGQTSPQGAETRGEHTLQMNDGQRAMEANVSLYLHFKYLVATIVFME